MQVAYDKYEQIKLMKIDVGTIYSVNLHAIS